MPKATKKSDSDSEAPVAKPDRSKAGITKKGLPKKTKVVPPSDSESEHSEEEHSETEHSESEHSDSEASTKTSKKKASKKTSKKKSKKSDSDTEEKGPRKTFNPTLAKELIDNCVDKLNDYIERTEKSKVTVPRDIRAVRRDLIKLQKHKDKVIKKDRKTRKENDVEISEELRKFLKLKKNDKLKRSDVISAVWAYITPPKAKKGKDNIKRWGYLNKKENGKERNLMKKTKSGRQIIKPDEALIRLFKYDDYVTKVKKGLITSKIKDKESGETTEVVVTDPSITMGRIQTFLKDHIKGVKEEKPKKKVSKKAKKVESEESGNESD